MANNIEVFPEGLVVHGPPKTVGVAANVGKNINGILETQGRKVVEMPNDLSPAQIIGLVEREQLAAIVTRTSLHFPEEVLKKTPTLSLIAAACKEPVADPMKSMSYGKNVLRSHNNTPFVVDTVIGVLMSMARGTLRGVVDTRNGSFDKSGLSKELFSLRDITVGIVGLGKIGQGVATMLRDMGVQVVACNDTPGTDQEGDLRSHDKNITQFASSHGIRLVDNVSDLVGLADVVTLHTNMHDHRLDTNNQVFTADHLQSLVYGKWPDGRKRVGGLINTSRYPLGPSIASVQGILGDANRGWFFTDVIDPNDEKDGGFQHPTGPGSERIFITPHLAGSDPTLAKDTAQHVGETLLSNHDKGRFDIGDSYQYQRAALTGIATPPGSIKLWMMRGTDPHTLDRIQHVLRGLELGIAGSRTFDDFVPGTHNNPNTAVRYPAVPSTFALTPTTENNRNYADWVKELSRGFRDLVKKHPEIVRRIMFIGTTPEQRAYLNNSVQFT